MANSKDLHVDKFLTNFAIEYKNDAYIGDMLFPELQVDKQSDRYKIYDLSTFGRKDSTLGEADLASEVDYKWSRDQYYSEDHGHRTLITWKTLANADEPNKHKEKAVRLVKDKVLLDKEYKAAEVALNTANYDSDLVITTGGGGEPKKWSDADSTPALDIENVRNIMHAKSGLSPNTLILPRPVINALKTNPSLLAIFKNTETSLVPLSYLKEFFEIDNIIIANASVAANEDGTGTKGYIWGKSAILAYVDSTPQDGFASFGFNFAWKGHETGTELVRSYDDIPRMISYYEYRNIFSYKIVSNVAGSIFPDVVA